METDAPEDAKILDRLQEYNDEAGVAERMQKISTGFSQSIGAIKQWLTRFGLVAADGTSCEVQLDMDICLEPLDALRAQSRRTDKDGSMPSIRSNKDGS